MWQKLKEQLPAIILTVLLVIGAAYWIHYQTVQEMTAQQDAALAPLREQNEALKASSEENRREIAATTELLKDAISKREADLFRRQPNDPSPYFANLNCLYLAPAASGF